MSELQHAPAAAARAKDLDRRLDHIRGTACDGVSALLDRTPDPRGRAGVSGLSGEARARALPVIIAARVLYFDGGVAARNVDRVVAFFHVGRDVAQRKLAAECHLEVTKIRAEAWRLGDAAAKGASTGLVRELLERTLGCKANRVVAVAPRGRPVERIDGDAAPLRL